jgi:hypothetical protein
MNLSAQLAQLGIAYALAAAGMLVALLVTRADRRAYFRWPVYSAMAMALGVIVWNLLRKYVLPAEWQDVTHAAFLYWGALAIYVVLGLSLGLLLGRITRRKVPPELRRDGGNHENE